MVEVDPQNDGSSIPTEPIEYSDPSPHRPRDIMKGADSYRASRRTAYKTKGEYKEPPERYEAASRAYKRDQAALTALKNSAAYGSPLTDRDLR